MTVMMASNNTDDPTSVSFPIAPTTTILFLLLFEVFLEL